MSRAGSLATAMAIYGLAAIVLLYRPRVLDGSVYIGHGTDPSLYVWMFRFLPDAIAHLQNPLVLREAWAPHGLNITEATTTPGLALLAWPLTAAFGPVVSFNIVSISAPALAASSAFLFASAYTARWTAAFVAGWLFGFSTYVFAALLGHLQVALIGFVPLAFLAVTLRAQGRMTSKGYISLLVAALVLQFLTSVETFVTEAIFLTLFTAATDTARSGGLMQLLRLRADNLLLGLIAAYAITAIIVSPMILAFFLDYSRIPHLLQNGPHWSTDLLDFMIPTSVTWLGGHLALPISQHFQGNIVENLGYVGLPLFTIVALACYRLRHVREAASLIRLLVASLLCTLGPRLLVFGHATFGLPWFLIERLPLLPNALPSRLMVFALLAMSGLVALWVEQLERHRTAALAALAFSAVFTLPATLIHPGWWHTRTPTARLFTKGHYRDLIGENDIVLFLPLSFGSNGNAMFWQVETHGYFRMTNGYGNFIPPSLSIWPAARMLNGGPPAPGFSAAFDEFAKAKSIRHVIVTQAQLAVWGKALRAAGWIGRSFGRLTVFDWPKASRATVTVGSPEAASYSFDRLHFRALQDAAACLLRKRAAEINLPTAVRVGCLDPAFRAWKRVPQFGDSQRRYVTNPNQDWMGGLLGRFGDRIVVGLKTTGANAARLAAAVSSRAKRIYYPYYPYGHVYRIGRKPAGFGTLLVIFQPGALTDKSRQSGMGH